MPTLTLHDLDKRLRRIEARRAARFAGLELIIIPSEISSAEAEEYVAARKAAALGKHCLVIEFVGPEGGPEEGTGYLSPNVPTNAELLAGLDTDEAIRSRA